MCTWLYVRFDCGIIIGLPSVWYACEHLKDGTCIGRWGRHEQRLVDIALPCLDLGPCCEYCRGYTLSRRARDWYFTRAIMLVQQELAAILGTEYWGWYKLHWYVCYSRRVLESNKSTGFITEDPDYRSRRSETSSSPDCLRRSESLPRVSTPCPVPEAERLPPMVAAGPVMERSFVSTQIFELELNDSGPNGNESHNQGAQGKSNWTLFESIGNPLLTCYSRIDLMEAGAEGVVAPVQYSDAD